MAKVLINETTLDGMAEAIRDTTGDTALMKPSAMVTAAEGIATEVSTQTTQIASNADLIAQIKTALDGKAGGSVETCTVTLINERDYDIDIIYASTTGCESTYMTGNSTFSFEAKKGSIIVLYGENLYYEVDGNIERIVYQTSSEGITLHVIYVDGDCTFRTIS